MISVVIRYISRIAIVFSWRYFKLKSFMQSFAISMLSKSNFSCILPFITMQYIFFYNSVTILHFIPRLLLQLSGNAYQDIRSLYCPLYFFIFPYLLSILQPPLRPVVKYFFEKLQNKKTGQKPCFFAFLLFGYKLGKINSKTERLSAW